jgi:hypothetical protein
MASKVPEVPTASMALLASEALLASNRLSGAHEV